MRGGEQRWRRRGWRADADEFGEEGRGQRLVDGAYAVGPLGMPGRSDVVEEDRVLDEESGQ